MARGDRSTPCHDEAAGSISRYKLPIYVTENGFALKDEHSKSIEEALQDNDHMNYFKSITTSLKAAVLEHGVDVRAYFRWRGRRHDPGKKRKTTKRRTADPANAVTKAGNTRASEENLNSHSCAVALALDDHELPVRVQAALAFTELVIVHNSVTLSLHTTLKDLVAHDFPDRWSSLLDDVKRLLGSGNSVQIPPKKPMSCQELLPLFSLPSSLSLMACSIPPRVLGDPCHAAPHSQDVQNCNNCQPFFDRDIDSATTFGYLTRQDLDHTKNLVLDLLCRGVSPECLAEAGVSAGVLYRVFTDINLRLPTNLVLPPHSALDAFWYTISLCFLPVWTFRVL
ncbi:hypothetical protein EDD22DRAFT_950639 [Suillus occidentalis]|nr:hypothetical protein EDD22DRAFT_950639 [Suillus occidentalis]